MITVVPNVIIAIRACIIFPECAIRLSYMGDADRLKKVGAFAGWQMLGCFCGLLRTQGISVLINKFYGPVANASMSIANTVNGHASTLASALITAFSPAITTACGEGDYGKMRGLAYRSCKLGLLLSLVFMLPLMVELPTVLILWLKEPPAYAVGLCWCMIAYYLVDVSTTGHLVVVNSSGKIAGYHVVLSAVSIFTLPLAALVAFCGFGVYSVGIILVFMISLNTLGRVYFARRVMQMSSLHWLFRVVLPVFMIVLVGYGAGFSVRFLLSPCFVRVVVTTLMCEVVVLPLSWVLVLDSEEKDFVKSKFTYACRKWVSK